MISIDGSGDCFNGGRDWYLEICVDLMELLLMEDLSISVVEVEEHAYDYLFKFSKFEKCE